MNKVTPPVTSSADATTDVPARYATPLDATGPDGAPAALERILGSHLERVSQPDGQTARTARSADRSG